MSRRKTSRVPREILPDSRFGSVYVQRLINVVMKKGKKCLATAIVYEAMAALLKKSEGGEDSVSELFEKIVNAVAPELEVKSRRVGGGVYQIPIRVRPERSLALSLRWIVAAAKARSDKTMGRRLAKELLDASDGKGGAIKKRTDIHRMADANRVYSHYAW
jgi:small subunit ribosomal protein S7